MKIGILSNTYLPTLNGVSVSVNSLEKHLIQAGHQVFLAVPEIESVKYPAHICVMPSVDVPKNFSKDLKLPFSYTQKVTNFFRKNQVEIIHSHDTVFGGIEAAMIAFRLRIPAIHTFHTMINDYQYFKLPGYKALVKSFIQTVCNDYDHIIAPSQKVYNYLLQIGVSTPLSQILNVPNLRDLQTEFSEIETQNIAKKLQIDPKNDFVITTFSRLAPEKGVDSAIQVLIPLLQKNPNFKFLILGDGPQKSELQNLVHQKNLQNQIIFFGKYQRSQLPLLTSFAKVFVFSSITENLPTNIFEAIFLGLPVIAVDDSSVDYLLKDGKNGKKVKLDQIPNQIQELFLNQDLLKQFSTTAKYSAKQISPETITQMHTKLYTRVLKRYEEKYELLQKEPSSLEKLQSTLQKFQKFRPF